MSNSTASSKAPQIFSEFPLVSSYQSEIPQHRAYESNGVLTASSNVIEPTVGTQKELPSSFQSTVQESLFSSESYPSIEFSAVNEYSATQKSTSCKTSSTGSSEPPQPNEFLLLQKSSRKIFPAAKKAIPVTKPVCRKVSSSINESSVSAEESQSGSSWPTTPTALGLASASINSYVVSNYESFKTSGALLGSRYSTGERSTSVDMAEGMVDSLDQKDCSIAKDDLPTQDSSAISAANLQHPFKDLKKVKRKSNSTKSKGLEAGCKSSYPQARCAYFHRTKEEWRARYVEGSKRRMKCFSLKKYRNDHALVLAEIFLSEMERNHTVPLDEEISEWYSYLQKLADAGISVEKELDVPSVESNREDTALKASTKANSVLSDKERLLLLEPPLAADNHTFQEKANVETLVRNQRKHLWIASGSVPHIPAVGPWGESQIEAPPPNTTVGIPPNTTVGIPPNTTVGIPPNTAIGIPPNTTVGIPPDTTVGIPPNTTVGIPPNTTVGIPPDTTVGIPPDTTVGIPPDTTVGIPPNTTVGIPPDTAIGIPFSVDLSSTTPAPSPTVETISSPFPSEASAKASRTHPHRHPKSSPSKTSPLLSKKWKHRGTAVVGGNTDLKLETSIWTASKESLAYVAPVEGSVEPMTSVEIPIKEESEQMLSSEEQDIGKSEAVEEFRNRELEVAANGSVAEVTSTREGVDLVEALNDTIPTVSPTLLDDGSTSSFVKKRLNDSAWTGFGHPEESSSGLLPMATTGAGLGSSVLPLLDNSANKVEGKDDAAYEWITAFLRRSEACGAVKTENGGWASIFPSILESYSDANEEFWRMRHEADATFIEKKHAVVTSYLSTTRHIEPLGLSVVDTATQENDRHISNGVTPSLAVVDEHSGSGSGVFGNATETDVTGSAQGIVWMDRAISCDPSLAVDAPQASFISGSIEGEQKVEDTTLHTRKRSLQHLLEKDIPEFVSNENMSRFDELSRTTAVLNFESLFQNPSYLPPPIDSSLFSSKPQRLCRSADFGGPTVLSSYMNARSVAHKKARSEGVMEVMDVNQLTQIADIEQKGGWGSIHVFEKGVLSTQCDDEVAMDTSSAAAASSRATITRGAEIRSDTSGDRFEDSETARDAPISASYGSVEGMDNLCGKWEAALTSSGDSTHQTSLSVSPHISSLEISSRSPISNKRDNWGAVEADGGIRKPLNLENIDANSSWEPPQRQNSSRVQSLAASSKEGLLKREAAAVERPSPLVEGSGAVAATAHHESDENSHRVVLEGYGVATHGLVDSVKSQLDEGSVITAVKSLAEEVSPMAPNRAEVDLGYSHVNGTVNSLQGRSIGASNTCRAADTYPMVETPSTYEVASLLSSCVSPTNSGFSMVIKRLSAGMPEQEIESILLDELSKSDLPIAEIDLRKILRVAKMEEHNHFTSSELKYLRMLDEQLSKTIMEEENLHAAVYLYRLIRNLNMKEPLLQGHSKAASTINSLQTATVERSMGAIDSALDFKKEQEAHSHVNDLEELLNLEALHVASEALMDEKQRILDNLFSDITLQLQHLDSCLPQILDRHVLNILHGGCAPTTLSSDGELAHGRVDLMDNDQKDEIKGNDGMLHTCSSHGETSGVESTAPFAPSMVPSSTVPIVHSNWPLVSVNQRHRAASQHTDGSNSKFCKTNVWRFIRKAKPALIKGCGVFAAYDPVKKRIIKRVNCFDTCTLSCIKWKSFWEVRYGKHDHFIKRFHGGAGMFFIALNAAIQFRQRVTGHPLGWGIGNKVKKRDELVTLSRTRLF